MNRLLSLSLALAASALLLIGLLAGSRSASVHAQQGGAPTPTPATVPGPVFDIQSLPLEGKVSPPRYPNLDSNLNRVVEQARTGQLTTRAAAASAPLHYSQSVAVTLYIIEGYADAIASYLEANGASPRNIDADYIEAYIPVSLLAEASEREGVLSARTIIPPHPDQGSVVSGGVAAHGVPSWHAAGYKGRDVKIGVIDLSFKGFAGLMGSELPATVQARCYASVGNFTTNLSDCISTSSPERSRRHGTAVTEALFDIAPQADYYISDAGSYRDLLNTVNWMVSQGVDVINMSLAWGFDGPGDGTSYYSNAPLKSVDAAVNGGIIWVNGAGNSARDSWYGAFEDSDSDGVHEFNASGNECNRVTIDLDPLEGFTAQLRWADSWGGASKDLNLYLISDPGSTFSLSDAVATSENNQVGAGNDIPYEWISIDHGDIANGEYCLAVNQTSGAAPSWIQLLLWGASDDLQNYVSAHSIGNPAESRNSGMLAAGAAPFSNTSTIESFSSRGPTTDNRTKPDIVGADGGTSSSRGTWRGTSQASPHVAGLAALVKQVYPSRSPSSIASYLKDNALGRDTVPNNTWGYGFARLPPPPDATLSALTLSDIDFGTLTSDTTSYFASVANSVTQTTITPTLNDSEASYVIKIGGVTDEDGTVSLAEGINVITVEVTDDDDETKKSYTVTVSRIGTLALTYKENGTASLHTLSANGLEQSTTTWSLEGTDYYYFTIGSTGILSFASSPDYESPADSGGDNVYEVTVSAKDAVLNSTAVEVTVTVEDVDEPPLITGVSTIDDYDENGAGDVATYTAIDPEGDGNITWSLAGADRGDFDITGGVLTFRNVPDYEHAADSGGNNHYEVTVQATDANNKRGELHIDVIVKNVDEPPVIAGPDTVDDYPENSAASRQVGRYAASDPEGATVTLSLTGTDSDDFTFASNGVLAFKESPDYEEQRSYRVTVRAEAGSHTVNKTVTVNIQNVEEAGAVTLSAVQPQEGIILTATLDDDDGPTGITWQWYRTSSRGSNGNPITNADSESYTPGAADVGSYLRAVASYDDGYGDDKNAAAVSSNRVQEAPPAPAPPVFPADGDYDRTIRENLRAGRNVGAPVTATDGNNDRLTYSIAASDEFEIVESTGQLRTKAELDYEGREQHFVTVTATDPGGLTDTVSVTITVTDVNEGPEISRVGSAPGSVRENYDPSLVLARYTATDPEGGTVSRWRTSGTDGGDFVISEQGELRFRNSPDYERPADSNRDNVYVFTVQVSDGRVYGNFEETVTVTPVDEPPTITTTSSSATELRQNENQTSRLYTYRATDPEQGTITWSVGGTDGRYFDIDERGQFSFDESSPPDFEQPGDSGRDNVYDATIQARDDGFNTASLPVTVTVANDAEGVEPTISTRRPPATYRENGTSAVYTFRASEPQRGPIAWTLEGDDRRDFTITGDSSGRGVLAFSVPPDFEDPSDSDRQNDYELTVIATDEDGHSDRLSFTINVTAVDEGPEVSGPSTFTIAENQGLSNAVYSATDPEGANVARWSVGGRDGGDFSITQGGTLYFRSPPDYERPADSNRDNVYELSIQPSDGRNTGSHPVTVTVTDVNEAPEIRRGSTTSFTQPENRTTRLYTYSATDPERGAITWSVGGMDGRFFTIDERGQFSFKEDSPPDFDTPEDDGRDNLYNVTIEARDPESNTASLLVTVRVTEVNEGPVITRQGNAPGSVPENHGVNQVLARYTASDPERPSVRITGWSTAGTDGGDFVINALGELRFHNSPDYERPADSNRDNVYEVTIRASDGRNTGTLEEVQVVTVTDVNEPPTITTTSRTTFSQPENRNSTLYTFRATDPEGGAVTWTAAGTDGRFFAIDEQGRFSFREDSPPDFDAPGDADRNNEYDVTVQARDDVFNSSSLDVVVTVTDHNENVEPTITTRRPPSTYRENGTSTIYTFRASDPQSGTTITWSLTGTDGGDFTIDRDSSGRGVLAFASPPDFESPADADRDNEYELAVVAADDEGNTDRVDFTIAVTNHNEGVEPTISTRRPPTTYRENGTSTVYTFRASDPQPGTTIRWSLNGTDAGDFTITVDTSGRGVLTFNSPPDFESPADSDQDNAYELAVVAADGDGNSDRVDFTIAVTDINEGPQIRLEGAATTTVPENTADTQVLARFTATDPEGGTVSRWRTSGTDGGDFVISEQGELRFRNSPDYERPADSNRDNVYVFTVQVSDGRYYGTFEETVTVTPVNEPPIITTTSSSATALRQNENQTSRLYTYRATDPEGSTVTWAAGGVDGRFFTIDERGQFSFKQENPPDFEQPGDSGRDNVYDVTVQVRDDGFNTASLPVKVTVREVNEGPEVTDGQSAFTISENQDLPNAVYSGFDPEGGTVTRWTVGGRDGGDFTITQEGLLTFRNLPDYERPADSNRDNTYELQVRPYDGRYYGSFDVTVTVTPVNESPTITTTSSSATALQQKENQTSRLYTYRATDPEQGTITWLVGGTDGRFFTIDERGQFSFSESSPPDFEHPGDSGRDNVYDATIQARDDGFNTASLPVTVTVANDAEGVEPTIGTRRPPSTYRENGTSAVYTFRASDPQRQSITWTLEGDDRRDFTITGDSSGRGVLAFSVPPDFEDPSDSDRQNDYELTVIATDEDGHSDRLSFTINVTAVDEGPEVSGPSTFTIAENQGLSNAVYSATDPEGANVGRWSVGGRDGGDFSITQGGTLYFRSPPDYERPADSNRDNVYELSIQPSDGRNTGSYPVTVTVTDVNEPPEFRRGSTTSFTQPENRTTRLYTFSATDPEQGTITWSVGGTDGNHFTIDERGQFSFKEDNPPDFDTPGDDGGDNLYNVTIEARDPESNTSRLPVTVRVTEINEGPVITRQGSAPGSVPENQGANQVLARYTASDPERPSVRITGWSTAGTDGGDFVMNALGELRFRNSPDFERPADSNRDNMYEVTIRASDGRNTGTLEEVQVVTVTDVNEPPTITTTSRTTFSQPENRNSTLYTFRATDPEGGAVTWTAAGTDGRFFAIDEQGRFSFREDSPPDFDAPGDAGGDNVYNVTVQARDDVFNSSSLDVVVAVTDHNENVEPTITTRRPPSTYRENGTSTIYTFRASDPQQGTTITWSLTGFDSGDFTITPDSSGRGVLTFNSPPDFESPADADRDNEYELAVVAADDEGNTDRVDFTIAVTNHNEGVEPSISTRRPPSTYRENNTSVVYTFRASDPQRGTTIRWSVTGNDAGDFTITRDSSGRGVLTFNSVPDFESPADANRDNEYELAVMATDDDGNADSVDFTITVTDINEPPVVTLDGTATTTVPENTADTQVLAKYTARDPENPTAGIYQWSTSGRDGGDFVISELGELRFRSSPDYERPADSNRDNVYEVTIRASDGRSYGMLEEPLSVTVTEVNEAPVITTKSRTEFSLRENSTSVLYTYRATDQDNSDTIRWSVEGADGGDFAIYTGVLTFRLLPDLENPVDSDEDNVYEITVVASDQAGLRDTVNAVITITDQSEGPVIAGRTSYTVAENYDITQVLGSYTATDAKDGRTVHPQWSLSGRDSGDFVIDRVSGALTFRNTPDYDRPADGNRDNVYEVTVRGHDSRAYGNLNVTVTVTNINEEAPVVSGRNSHTVRENTTSSIYTYRATDSDLNDTIVWSTGGADGHLFQVSDRGELSFREAPDFETPRDAGQDNEYALEVVATDGEGLRGTLGITVTVTELNEGPVVSGTPTFAINENLDLSGATYTASDPEAIAGVTTTITWSTAGRDGGDFNIDRETGVLTFRSLPDYERPADSNRDNEYEVTVRAYDGRSYGTYDVTVTVLAVNEGPEITGRDAFSYRENGTSALYTYRATDPEGDEYTWDLGGLDASDFEISDRGVLTFASPPNFDSPAGSGTNGNEYLVTVQARDDQGNTGELPVTITVTDQNEGATVSGRTEIAVQENRDPSLVLATYTASDPEGQAITRWSLGGSDSGDFSISGDGELTFRNTPDYDRPADSNRDNEYRITVRAYDGRTYGNLDVTITVSNQNEHDPVIRSGSRTSFNYREESTSALYTYRATDQDKDDVITWTTAGTDGHLFEFDEQERPDVQGTARLRGSPGCRAGQPVRTAVVATDSGGLSRQAGCHRRSDGG